MTQKDNAQDEELLARYRQASARDRAAPSEAVRAAILAESRRIAEQLAKKAPQGLFDVSRPAANDSRWKIPAFGTVGAALLAALLFAPRYWESQRAPEVSSVPYAAPAAKIAYSGAAAPAPTTAPPLDAVPLPKMESVAPSRPSESLQEIVVTQASPPTLPAAPLAYAARAAQAGAAAMSADRATRQSGVPSPANLQSAAGMGDVRQAALLLDQGVPVDGRDEYGRTALMLAVAQDRLEVVRMLLARGADPNAADSAGRTPLQQAKDRNLRDVAALLEQAAAH